MAESKNRDPLSISTVPRDLLNIGSRFADIHPLGYGGGGLVFSAKDLTHNRNICIKKISFFDQHSCRQALREVKIIRQLNHENITKLHEVLNPDGTSLHHADQDDAGNSRTVFFVQELLDTDLRHLINSKQLNHSHIKLLMYQFFRGLKYIHSANVLHRDLKPANLFINCDTLVLKIGDFGTSRVVDPNYDHSGHLTAHVGTCWYRSPEAVLSPSDYSRATDLWSAGCIAAECFLGAPMFPGAHELDQILHVIDTIHLMDQDWTKVLKVMPNKLLKNHPFRPRTPLRQKLAGADPQALDVIEAVLAFDPKSRLSAEETLSHPYFEQYSCLKEEPISAQPFWIEHEVDDLPLETLQVSLIQEVQALTTSPPVDGLPSPAETQQDETHTLEEIFHMPGPTRGPTRGQESRHSSGGSSTGNPSSKHNVRNQNAKNRRRGDNTSTVTLENIRNSQNTLRNRQNILDISGQKPGEEGSQGMDTESVSEVVRKIVKTTESEEEKDIADCSPRKIREDQELGINEIIHRSEELDLDVDKSGNHDNDVVHMYSHMLEVQIDDTENLKEFSQPSPKNLSPSQSITGCRVTGHNSPVTQSGPNRGHAVVRGAASVRHRNPGRPPPERDNKEEFSKKQRLKEEAAITISRKLILDKIETEKDMNIEQSTHHSSLTSEELDELYRLPTDHLSENRDLSNERLKHQHIARRNPSPWSHQIQGRKHHQSINERFKEDKFYQGEAGACGGYEHSPDLSDHSEPEEILQSLLADNITSHFAQARDSVSPARSLYDIDINLDVLPMTTPEQAPPTRDPLSSPESPPSPNGVRSGARPKKSPKKQRAL